MTLRVGVLVDRHEPERGGMERALSRLVEHLLAAGHAVHVYGLSTMDGAPGAFHRVDVPRLPRGALERELAERSLAAAAADGCDLTLAVRHAPEVDVYWPHGGAHAATLAAGERARGALAGPVSRLLHRVSPRHRAFLELETKAMGGGARTVWCVSELVRRELADAHPGCDARLELHANGVDRDAFHPRLRERHRDVVRSRWGTVRQAPVVLVPGGSAVLKGWNVLLRALDAVSATPWTCVVLGCDGDGAERDVRAAGLERRVLCVPRQDMAQALGAADLVVQPTYRDPCSLATLEALASGVPVVTTDANGAAEALRDAAAGAVVPVGDIAAFAGALRAWLRRVSDESSRREASRSARAATAGRDATTWLRGMEASLLRLAAG